MTVNSFSGLLALAQVLDNEDLYETRTINNDTGQILYVGKNITPNASTASSTWYVKKISYDGNGFLNRVQLPDDGAGFYYTWDNVSDYFS